MRSIRKEQICALLKGIETGDPEAVAVVDQDKYIQHNPELEDGSGALKAQLEAVSAGRPVVQYGRAHRVLAEGSFALSVSEGFLEGVHSSFYDLFRIEHGKLVEHWDTIEAVPAPALWKNENGKF